MKKTTKILNLITLVLVLIGLAGCMSGSSLIEVGVQPVEAASTPATAEVLPTLVPSETPLPTNTPTATPTSTPTNTPTATPTSTPTNTPTVTPLPFMTCNNPEVALKADVMIDGIDVRQYPDEELWGFIMLNQHYAAELFPSIPLSWFWGLCADDNGPVYVDFFDSIFTYVFDVEKNEVIVTFELK